MSIFKSLISFSSVVLLTLVFFLSNPQNVQAYNCWNDVYVYNDINNNCTRQVGPDIPLPGVLVNIHGYLGTTDANGQIHIIADNVGPMSITMPSGYGVNPSCLPAYANPRTVDAGGCPNGQPSNGAKTWYFPLVILATPTPIPPWTQVQGGEVYQNQINNNNSIPPGGIFFLNDLPGQLNSQGIVQSPNVLPFPRSSLSNPTHQWFAQTASTQISSFSSYWESLNNQALPIVNQPLIGRRSDVSNNGSVFRYADNLAYTLDTSDQGITKDFKGHANDDVIIFLIKGSLQINENYANDLKPRDVVVFVVDGPIQITGNVTNISGLFITNNVFTISQEAAADSPTPIDVNGMILANATSFNRRYSDAVNPAYKIYFQPHYVVKLIPFVGRSQISWQELAP